MDLRSMPVSVVFKRFPRLVHDLSRQLGKDVELGSRAQTPSSTRRCSRSSAIRWST